MSALTGHLCPILTVRDPARSGAWYGEVLGLEVRHKYADPDGRVRDVSVIDPGSGLEIGLVDHGASAGETFSELRTGLDHLELMVEARSDLDEWAKRFDELGVLHSGVKQPSYSRNAMITFRDPDNIQLELFWRAPAAAAQ